MGRELMRRHSSPFFFSALKQRREKRLWRRKLAVGKKTTTVCGDCIGVVVHD